MDRYLPGNTHNFFEHLRLHHHCFLRQYLPFLYR